MHDGDIGPVRRHGSKLLAGERAGDVLMRELTFGRSTPM
jgi:hypothetical protein